MSFFGGRTNWWSLSEEGLLSTGPSPSSSRLDTIKYSLQNISITWRVYSTIGNGQRGVFSVGWCNQGGNFVLKWQKVLLEDMLGLIKPKADYLSLHWNYFMIYMNPKLDTRISVLCPSVRHAQGTPPEIWTRWTGELWSNPILLILEN